MARDAEEALQGGQLTRERPDTAGDFTLGRMLAIHSAQQHQILRVDDAF